MPLSQRFYTLGALLLSLSLSAYAETYDTETYDDCLARLSATADENTTLKELRLTCKEPETIHNNPVQNRAKKESETRDNRFTITPHKPNYILPISYNTEPNSEPYNGSALTDNFSNTEIKFQLSVKAPLSYGVFDGYGDLWVAYTNTSWWQAYNDNSAPFRETNHEPEVFFTFPMESKILGMDLNLITLGFSHQSNGRSGNLSRSWNRLYANFVMTKDNFVLSVKPWWRVPESEKPIDPVTGETTSAEGDDNPDIYNYMGYGELGLAYKLDKHTVSVMMRNNLRKDNRGALQLDWSFPINDRFKGYVQYFNGYGESLIDYDNHTTRYSIGVMLTDWL